MSIIEKISKQLANNFPDADIRILDPLNDGIHLKAIITTKKFENKTLIEQHRLVNTSLQDFFHDGSLHSLEIETSVSKP